MKHSDKETIKAVGVQKAGAANTLKLIQLPKPIPKSNEIIIEQIFAGVNFGDAIRRKRGMFELNDQGYFVPGFEGAGQIIRIGSKVKKFQLGDRVAYLSGSGGGYSQQVSIPEKFVFKIPEGISNEIAAGMTCVGATAWQLVHMAHIKKGDWVLIHGAAGGVGLILIQLCISKGAQVIAVVGTEKKRKFLERFEAIHIIVREKGNTSPKINELTNGEKVNTIFDCVGQAVLDINMEILKKGGQILYFGSTSGHPNFPGMNLLMNSIRIQGFNVFNLMEDKQQWSTVLNAFFESVQKKKLEFFFEKVFKMDEAYKAHELLENRQSIGKILINLQ